MSDSEEHAEPTSWQDLIQEVKSCPVESIGGRSGLWSGTVAKLPDVKGGGWEQVVGLLPVALASGSSEGDFRSLLVSEHYTVADSVVAFLDIAARGGLFSRWHWAEQLAEKSQRIVAGCINLLRLASRSAVPTVSQNVAALQSLLAAVVGGYPLTIASLRLSAPDLVALESDSCVIAGTLAVPRADIHARHDDHEGEDIVLLLRRHRERLGESVQLLRELHILDAGYACRVFSKFNEFGEKLQVRDLLDLVIRPFRDDLDDQNWGGVVADAVEKCTFCSSDEYLPIFEYGIESYTASRAFRRKCEDLKPGSFVDEWRQTFFNMWARFLPQDEAFEYCWRACFAEGHQQDFLLGESVDQRLDNLHQLVLRPMMEHHERGPFAWRGALIRFMRPVLSLVELHRGQRRRAPGWLDESAARQQEAIDVLEECPDLVPVVVTGMVDWGEDEWDVLDPIILGLPADRVIACLEQYASSHHPHTSHYHARRLLAHLEGAVSQVSPSGATDASMLGAVESLVAASRSAAGSRRSDLWLGNWTVENLWTAAADAATAEFQEYFDSQYGQDEHEHVAVLADALARHLNGTNAIVNAWLGRGDCQKALLRATVRRFPKTAPANLPQEGGRRGVQADLAILVKADMPGLAVADRVTLIQAKKIAKARNGVWESSCSVNLTQLRRLVKLSPCAHYVFFAHSELGPGPSILPAFLIQDVCQAQGSPKAPVPLILRASKSLSVFLIQDMIGLWTGDPRKGVLALAEGGDTSGHGARVVLEVRVSREHCNE